MPPGRASRPPGRGCAEEPDRRACRPRAVAGRGAAADALRSRLALAPARTGTAGTARALLSLGLSRGAHGDLPDTLKFARQALATAKRFGNRHLEEHSWHAIGWAEQCLGHPAESVVAFRQAWTSPAKPTTAFTRPTCSLTSVVGQDTRACRSRSVNSAPPEILRGVDYSQPANRRNPLLGRPPLSIVTAR